MCEEREGEARGPRQGGSGAARPPRHPQQRDHRHLLLRICLELNLWVTAWASPCLSCPAGHLLITAASALLWLAVSAAPVAAVSPRDEAWPHPQHPTPACTPPFRPLIAPRALDPVTDGSATAPLGRPILVPMSQTHLLIYTLTHPRTMSPSEIILFRYCRVTALTTGDAAVRSSVPPAAGSTLGPGTQSSIPPGLCLIDAAALTSSLIN